MLLFFGEIRGGEMTMQTSKQFQIFHYVYLCVCVSDVVCGSQRTACRSHFSPSSVWIPGIHVSRQSWWQAPLLPKPSSLINIMDVLKARFSSDEMQNSPEPTRTFL